MLELSEYNMAPLSTHMSHISIILDDCNNLLSVIVCPCLTHFPLLLYIFILF
jgi:hypothetical protein